MIKRGTCKTDNVQCKLDQNLNHAVMLGFISSNKPVMMLCGEKIVCLS